MVRKRMIAGVALAAAVGLALSACSTGAPQATSGTTDTINAELWYAPATFDPAKASASSDVTVARLGFDTLLRQGETEGYHRRSRHRLVADLRLRLHLHHPRRRHLLRRHRDHADRRRRLVRVPGRSRRLGRPDLEEPGIRLGHPHFHPG